MSLSLTTQYAVKSLGRHKRRTLLSVVGIGLGCSVCVFMIAFVRGESQMMLRAAAESGNGHLRIVPAAWTQTRENDLRLTQWHSILTLVNQNQGIRIATPHARKEGLLAFGTRSTGLEIVGVDPNTEQSANRLVRKIDQGHYLNGDLGTTVIGQTVATRLDVELDDELMVTAAAQGGDIQSAMLRIVGIVSTGSKDLDATICHIHLQDLEQLTGLSGAGDITILVTEPRRLSKLHAALEETLPAEAKIVTWREIVPELASGTKIDETWTRLTVGIIMLVVFLGIASAQLTAVLERRREFAVLSALGMRGAPLVRIMIVEGLFLGLAGGLLGLILGGAFAHRVATVGIDFSKMYGEVDMSVSNILIDPVFYGDFGWWIIPLAFELALSAALLSSLYPAWYAARTDPAAALRVEH
jgi:ABC-type lipoprotein release transport system permease subunit